MGVQFCYIENAIICALLPLLYVIARRPSGPTWQSPAQKYVFTENSQ